MKRIKTITLTNFKFFRGATSIQLEGHNAIFYGENGTGKSSIFWALYTFFESSYKSHREITKYFDLTHKQSLVNSIPEPGVNSSIRVTFSDDREYEIAIDKFDTTEDIIKTALRASDFVTHRFLSRMYDFRNSEPIDLFPALSKDVLHNVIYQSKNLGDLWDAVAGGLLKEGNKKPRPNDSKVTRYQSSIELFNETLMAFLGVVIPSTNVIISEVFKENMTIKIDTPLPQAVMYKPTDPSISYHVHPPKVLIKFDYKPSSEISTTFDLQRPHTYLNEGRLTIAFLALRMAIIDNLLQTSDIKLLAFDDLLLSLDMGYRELVMNSIFDRYSQHQIILFTHDRAFLSKFTELIDRRKMRSEWEIISLYIDKGDSGIPIPKIHNHSTSDNIERARYHLSQFDYPATANYVRKSFEEQLIRIIPTQLLCKDKANCKLTLVQLLSSYELFNSSCNSLKEIELNTLINQLATRRDMMNAFSHFNCEENIYRSELEQSLSDIIKLKDFQIHKLISPSDNLKICIPGIGEWSCRACSYCFLVTSKSDSTITDFEIECYEHNITNESFTGPEAVKSYSRELIIKSLCKMTQSFKNIEGYLNKWGVKYSLTKQEPFYIHTSRKRLDAVIDEIIASL